MSILCVAAVTISVALPVHSFTLAWTHSIEKIRWEEDYSVTAAGLVLTEARVRGSGAGMEPPPGAILKNGTWHYRPELPPLQQLRLARSPYTADYSLCWQERCHPMADIAGPVEKAPEAVLSPC